jgi:hypothetical protein
VHCIARRTSFPLHAAHVSSYVLHHVTLMVHDFRSNPTISKSTPLTSHSRAFAQYSIVFSHPTLHPIPFFRCRIVAVIVTAGAEVAEYVHSATVIRELNHTSEDEDNLLSAPFFNRHIRKDVRPRKRHIAVRVAIVIAPIKPIYLQESLLLLEFGLGGRRRSRLLSLLCRAHGRRRRGPAVGFS